jgi:hypothetical protein
MEGDDVEIDLNVSIMITNAYNAYDKIEPLISSIC